MTQREVADELGIERRLVVRWAKSSTSDFPKPVKIVARTYLFSRRDIETWGLDRAWAERRRESTQA
jgi:predicted DNA-binding transcriptional regulator AlpA